MESALSEYLVHAPVFVRTVDGLITDWTIGASELYGFTRAEAEGRRSHELLRTRFPQPLAEIDAVLLRDGHWQGLLTHTRADGRALWTESKWRLRKSGGGRVDRVVEVNTDVTHRELLTRELDHRVKNTLAVVQSLARLSFANCDREALRSFDRRLVALGHAQALLNERTWRDADVGEVLRRVLVSLGVEDRVEASGPALALQASAAVAYSLAFSELATHALVNGALAHPPGSVQVTWEPAASGRVHLIWRERGASAEPPADAPELELVSRAFASEVGQTVEIRFEDGGLVCEVNAPLGARPREG